MSFKCIKFRFLSFLFLSFLTVSFTIGTSIEALAQTTLKDLVGKALDQYSKGNFDQAIKIYDEALQKFGENPAIYVLKAEAYTGGRNKRNINTGSFEPKSYRLALECLNRALQLAPENPQIFLSRGNTNLIYHQYKDAIEAFTLALKHAVDPEMIYEATADRATAKMMVQDFAGAVKDFEVAVKMRPDNAENYINLGSVYARMKNYKKAEELYLKGLKLDPKNDGLMNNLGFMFLRAKNYQKALEWFDKTIKTNPKMEFAYGNRGYAKLMLGQVEEAKKDIDIAILIGPKNPFAFKYRAIYYIKQKQLKLACEDLQKANQLGYSEIYGQEVNELIKKHCK